MLEVTMVMEKSAFVHEYPSFAFLDVRLFGFRKSGHCSYMRYQLLEKSWNFSLCHTAGYWLTRDISKRRQSYDEKWISYVCRGPNSNEGK